MTYDQDRKVPNSAAYQRQHRWVKKQLGIADHCSIDKTHVSTRYDWSNISKEYLYSLSDWRQLCRACHKEADPLTKEGKKQISEKNKINSIGNTNHNKPVMVRYPMGSWLKLPSSKAAARLTGVSRTSIANIISGLAKKTHSGFSFERIEV